MADHTPLEPEKVINITKHISGEQVKEIVLDSIITIVLRNGKKIVIEPDIYPEIILCREGEWDCYMENVRFSIHEEEER
ncbi:MAG: hypothetical protein QXL19_07685 [Ignisphaera sp.]